ncbi:MAG: hypothetical protein GX616_12865, partial [Planctomycetes bacterium]|nr:hypothetical protein [Planctomycetota bacterium]
MELVGYWGFAILAAGSIAGLLLLAFGLRGRKVDDFPYCRKCRYNLTGLTGQRCPECGSVTTEVGVILGQRRRRWKLIAAGLVLFMPLAAVLIGAQTQWARSVNWYQKLPTWWVFRDAQSDNARFANPACTELKNRFGQGELSPSEIHRLADLAIGDVTEESRVERQRLGIDGLASERVLHDLLFGGHLSPSHLKTLFESGVKIEMSARPRSAINLGIPVALRTSCTYLPDGVIYAGPVVMLFPPDGGMPGLPPFPLPEPKDPFSFLKNLPDFSVPTSMPSDPTGSAWLKDDAAFYLTPPSATSKINLSSLDNREGTSMAALAKQAHMTRTNSLVMYDSVSPPGFLLWFGIPEEDVFLVKAEQTGPVELRFAVCMDFFRRNGTFTTSSPSTPLYRVTRHFTVRSEV